MKIKDLVLLLQDMDPEAEVICQSDAEGNSYSPLAGVDKGFYVEDSTYAGTVYNSIKDIKDELGETEYTRCIVIYPVN